MQLSVIIVNYNVKHFMHLCLLSAQKAIAEIDAEIIVVDNNSSDNSVPYLSQLFPDVKFITNTKNAGFGKANNQALAVAKGEYVLYLNPDTIVPEDAFVTCIDFLNKHKSAGAIGVQMIDGSGNFLPESKRAFPAPLTSFFKLSGLSSAFPNSKVFNKYALGFLNKNETHKVDVLAGAFIMASKDLLTKLNGFDEAFFMYGEDVDLSYRIQNAGFENYYLPQPTIIHFKGESTGQNTDKYVNNFYEAMTIFVNKHYGGSKKTFTSLLLNTGIFFRKSIKFLSYKIKKQNTAASVLESSNALIIFSSKADTKHAEGLQQSLQQKNRKAEVISDYLLLEQHITKQKTDVLFYINEINYKQMIGFIQLHPQQAGYHFYLPQSNIVISSGDKTTVGNIMVI